MPDFDRWFEDNSEHLRYEYNLDSNSVVFDLGAFEGTFTKEIFEKYGSHIYSFEPVKKNFDQLVSDFFGNSNVKIFNYGIGANNRKEEICLSGNSSSIIAETSCDKETVEIRSVSEVLSELKVEKVDLIKINVEGCEYEILEEILEKGLQKKFVNIQVQFHDFVEGSKEKRETIRTKLLETHKLTYDYEFVWENFCLK